MAMRPNHPAWVLGSVAIVGVLLLVFGHYLTHVDTRALGEVVKVTQIPPTFGADRLLYGFVLALMLTMSAFAFGAAIENVRFLSTNTAPRRSPVKVTVFNETILLGAVLCSIVPDVLVLMSWGELMAPSYAFMSKLDRGMDGFAAIVFGWFIVRRVRARPTLLFLLQQDTIPVELEPKWEQLRSKLLIAVVVIVISFGVAFGK